MISRYTVQYFVVKETPFPLLVMGMFLMRACVHMKPYTEALIVTVNYDKWRF